MEKNIKRDKKTLDKRKRKKGELTSAVVIGVIGLLICIAIIFFLWRNYQWTPIIERESCHQSIVYRSSVNWGVIKASYVVPIKCQTERICMTMSGEDCFQVGVNSKDNPVKKIQLNKDPVKARQQIIIDITDSMYDCHSMLGEGQLLFMPNKVGWGEDYWNYKNYCLMCARFVFDLEAREKIEDIRYSELYQALGNRLNPQKKTYLEYLHPDWKDWKSVARLFQQLKENAKPDEILGDIQFKNNGEITIESDRGATFVKNIYFTYRKDGGWYWNFNDEGWYSSKNYMLYSGETIVGPDWGPATTENNRNRKFIEDINGKSCIEGVDAILAKVAEDDSKLPLKGYARVVVHSGGRSEILNNDKTVIEKLCKDMENLSPGVEQKSLTIKDFKIEDWKMNMKDEGGFAVIAQIAPESYWKSFALTGTVVAGSLLVASGIGAPAGIALIGTGAAGGAAFLYSSPTGDFYYSPPSVQPYNLETLQSLACDSFETAP